MFGMFFSLRFLVQASALRVLENKSDKGRAQFV